jgi:hypothetical protein
MLLGIDLTVSGILIAYPYQKGTELAVSDLRKRTKKGGHKGPPLKCEMTAD